MKSNPSRVIAELPYAGVKARKTFAKEFETPRKRLMGHLAHIPGEKRESVVISMLCLCLGAVALSRALPESKWKRRILEICRTEAQERVAKAG